MSTKHFDLTTLMDISSQLKEIREKLTTLEEFIEKQSVSCSPRFKTFDVTLRIYTDTQSWDLGVDETRMREHFIISQPELEEVLEITKEGEWLSIHAIKEV